MATNTISILIQAKDQASRELDQLSNHVEKSRTHWLKLGAVMGIVSGTAQSLVTKGINAVTSSIDDAIKRVDTLNNSPKILENLGFQADESAKSIKTLDLGMRGLPTRLDDAASALTSIAAASGDGLEKSTKLTLAFNDMALAGGKGPEAAKNALIQYTQALGKGTFQMQDFRTLLDTMPAQLKQVAEHLLGTGSTAMDLQDAIMSGKLSIDDFNDAIIDLDTKGGKNFASFKKQAKDATQGIGTGISNAKAAVIRGVADIIKAIGEKKIYTVITDAGKAVEDLMSQAGKAIAIIKDLGKQVGDYLGPKMQALWDIIKTKLFPALERLWREVLEPLSKVFGEALVVAIGLAIDAVGQILSVLGTLIDFALDHKDFLLPLLVAIGSLKLALDISSAVSEFKKALDMTSTATAFGKQMGGMGGMVGGLRKKITSPMAMPAITVAAAMTSLALVLEAVNSVRGAIEAMNDAKEAKKRSDEAGRQLRSVAARQYNLGKISKREYDRLMDMSYDSAAPPSGWDQFMTGVHFGTGTNYAPGGWATINEHGRERVYLPQGTQVQPAYRTRQDAAQNKSITMYVTNNINNGGDYHRMLSDIGFALETAS